MGKNACSTLLSPTLPSETGRKENKPRTKKTGRVCGCLILSTCKKKMGYPISYITSNCDIATSLYLIEKKAPCNILCIVITRP
jgi:hypothetical protein